METNVREDPQQKALRECLIYILRTACNIQPKPKLKPFLHIPVQKPPTDFDTVRACRLVSKDWNEEISRIFVAAGKSVLVVDPILHLPKKKRREKDPDPKTLLDTLKIPLARRESLLSDLHFPPTKLCLPPGFFYKEVENSFVYSEWVHFERYLHEIHIKLPADSTMSFWPQLNLCSLKKIIFECTPAKKVDKQTHRHDISQQGVYCLHFLHQILNSAKNVETFIFKAPVTCHAAGLFRMPIPEGIKTMDVPLLKMSRDEFMDCMANAPPNGNVSLKSLAIQAPNCRFNLTEDHHCSYLIKKYGNSLTHLNLSLLEEEEYIDGLFNMIQLTVRKPFKVDLSTGMKNLTSLELDAGAWEINGMRSYQRQLPCLKNLKLTHIKNIRSAHIRDISTAHIKELYRSRSDTVERLNLSFCLGIPIEVWSGFANNLPCLKELEVFECVSELGWFNCIQRFAGLKKLSLGYFCQPITACKTLYSDISGIPEDKFQELRNKEMSILDAIKTYDKVLSLRNLVDLEEISLIVKEAYYLNIDAKILLQTTFFRMPNLKKLKLSKNTRKIHHALKDFISKENTNGLVIEWI